jgi:hypothetical protein
LRPAAGTANGVHPVPLGFSRVYVHLDEPFSFDAWMAGLAAGRSFVTTGPMIFGEVDGKRPGAFLPPASAGKEYRLDCLVSSEQPLEVIELIVNGRVIRQFEPSNHKTSADSFESRVSTGFNPARSSWLAWRCFERRPNNRLRFAHTAPWHFEVPGHPIRPRRAEIDWLVARVKEEIARSEGIAPPTLIADYQRALEIYEQLASTAE